jgi:hypothetical protein
VASRRQTIRNLQALTQVEPCATNIGACKESSSRVSVLLRKERSDRGESHLSETVNSIIDTAINEIYLTAVISSS